VLDSDGPTLTRRRPARFTFLYLPEGDDLIAYREGTRYEEPPMFHQVSPHEQLAPLGTTSTQRRMADFLQWRIDHKHVVGLPGGTVDVVDDGREIPVACPVYECAGGVVESDSGVELRLHSEGLRNRRVHYTIIGAEGQAAVWSTRAGWTDAAVAEWTTTGGSVAATRTGRTAWSLAVDGLAAAEAVTRAKVDLGRPGGLTTNRTGTVATYLDVSFTPADQAARRVFAMQDALSRITSTVADSVTDDALTEAVSTAASAYGLGEDDLTEEAVRDRLWLDGHFLHVYALRKDFVGYG
jgi:hypothetical protein